jgi:Putative Flp pilus-assembly TadE/G-like
MYRRTTTVEIRKSRGPRGSVLILACVMFCVLAIALLIGYSFGGLFFTHNRLQTSANEIALAGARKLNELDRIGQMNNMVARSRQLVAYSRKQLEDCQNNQPGLEALAQELLNEARVDAKSLEAQRKSLHALAQGEAFDAMDNKLAEIEGSYPMNLPWLKVTMPVMVEANFGKCAGVETNVEQLQHIDEVESKDGAASYVTTGGGLKLYKNDIDAKLDGSDSDLTFKISSLPAPVQKTVSPARIVLASAFRDSVGDQIPTCCQVKIRLNVSSHLGVESGGVLESTGTAGATGASAQQ